MTHWEYKHCLLHLHSPLFSRMRTVFDGCISLLCILCKFQCGHHFTCLNDTVRCFVVIILFKMWLNFRFLIRQHKSSLSYSPKTVVVTLTSRICVAWIWKSWNHPASVKCGVGSISKAIVGFLYASKLLGKYDLWYDTRWLSEPFSKLHFCSHFVRSIVDYTTAEVA